MNNKLPKFEDNLKKLIASASVSSVNPAHDMSNEGVIHLLGEWLDHLGFNTEVQSVGVNGKQNLIATIGSGTGGLVMSGHSDTVPYDDIQWLSDPFKCTRKENGFYGLGSTDMKGFFAVALEAIQQIDLNKLKSPLTFIATADEESTMSGARFLGENGLSQGEAVIIGEPTNLRPVRMHKGITMQSIRITGRSGHSSNPLLGNSALEAMVEVMQELQRFRVQLQSKYNNEGFKVTVPTMNLGCIHGGDNPNRICGRCELQYDLRTLPGMSIPELTGDILKLLEPIAERREISIDHEILFGDVEAFEEPADSPLVELADELSGSKAESAAFATEAPFYKSLGKQTLVLGPGSIDQAHQPNEYLPEDQIEPAINIYRRFIEHYCL